MKGGIVDFFSVKDYSFNLTQLLLSVYGRINEDWVITHDPLRTGAGKDSSSDDVSLNK